MNQIKTYLIVISIVFLFFILHFFSSVYQGDEGENKKNIINDSTYSSSFYISEFSAEQLSDLFGIDYQNTLKEENKKNSTDIIDSGENNQILLNDVDVFIKAVSKKDGVAIVYVSYDDNGQKKRDKIAINDQLFGYTLVEVKRGILTFERDGQMINYTIFKEKKKTEGNR